MEEIMRRFSEKAKDRGTEVRAVGEKETQVTRSSDQTDDESMSPEGRSELPVKRFSSPARILKFPFIVGEDKLFKHDDHIIVFEHFKDVIEEVDKSTFMSWFQRGFKPKNKSHTLTVFNSAGKTYCDWKVLEGIEQYVKILPALMNALEILKKDPDYHEPDCKELKVHIDSTLPQQTNG
ncbi:Hypothetical predicted protein [Olea europaea subsp. europaea]|uniref:Uncharacterized protein n=1 Tax=Olea europaea subsp. europaea TaxID=158383 RepID=A0A8S0UHI3_OLEEU|nr:Hypothetical predicted protein [Olea europaea subsp. europaea]